jgi:hypothetical protein
VQTTLLIAIIVAVAVLSVNCDSNSGFRQDGYFKDEKGNRIMTYAFKPNESDETILKHASALTFTEGQIFTVYYYPEGARIPKDNLTLAKGVSKAYAVIDNPTYSRPRYAVMRELVNASIYFVDCNKKPKDGLCHPEQPLTKKEIEAMTKAERRSPGRLYGN